MDYQKPTKFTKNLYCFQVDGALHLTGTNAVEISQLSDCLASPAICPDGFSLAFWIKRNALSPQFIMTTRPDGNFDKGGFSIDFSQTEDKITLNIMDENLDEVIQHMHYGLPSVGTWAQYLVKYKSGNTSPSTIPMYRDGNLVTPNPDPISVSPFAISSDTNNRKLVFGKYDVANANIESSFDIDDVFIFEYLIPDVNVNVAILASGRF